MVEVVVTWWWRTSGGGSDHMRTGLERSSGDSGKTSSSGCHIMVAGDRED